MRRRGTVGGQSQLGPALRSDRSVAAPRRSSSAWTTGPAGLHSCSRLHVWAPRAPSWCPSTWRAGTVPRAGRRRPPFCRSPSRGCRRWRRRPLERRRPGQSSVGLSLRQPRVGGLVGPLPASRATIRAAIRIQTSPAALTPAGERHRHSTIPAASTIQRKAAPEPNKFRVAPDTRARFAEASCRRSPAVRGFCRLPVS